MPKKLFDNNRRAKNKQKKTKNCWKTHIEMTGRCGKGYKGHECSEMEPDGPITISSRNNAWISN